MVKSDIGKELWCNRIGEYVSLVRDFGDYPDMQSISICDFPIFGYQLGPAPIESRLIVLSNYEPVYLELALADFVTIEDIPEVYIQANQHT